MPSVKSRLCALCYSSSHDMDTEPDGGRLRGAARHPRVSRGIVPEAHQLLDYRQSGNCPTKYVPLSLITCAMRAR